MKEFVSQLGGRYTYVDDIVNLQELALSMVSMFSECDNFIVSGCGVNGMTVDAGYVYLNGKIRKCSGLTSVGRFPVYIYESNSEEKVSYADSGSKVGRRVYGCVAATSVPATPDPITGKAPQYITVTSDGKTPRLKDAFLATHSLLLNPSATSQTVQKNVRFTGEVSSDLSMTAGRMAVVSGSSKLEAGYDNGTAFIRSVPSGGMEVKLVMGADGVLKVYRGGTLAVSISGQGTAFTTGITAPKLMAGNLAVTGQQIANVGQASNTAMLDINVTGYNGGTSYWRRTRIGDGKGGVLLDIDGQTGSCLCSAVMKVSDGGSYPLSIVHPTLAKTDSSLVSSLAWRDKNGDVMGHMGYANSSNTDLYIRNAIGRIVLDGDVVINGKLYMGGKEMSEVTVSSKDTGWITMRVLNCGITTSVYVRQTGNVVSIQGELHTHHSGTIFELPNNIDPPRYDIGYGHGKYGWWHCKISGGTRSCVVDACSGGCSEYIGFLMTYLV